MTIWVTTNGRPSNGARELAKQPGFRRAIKGGKVRPQDYLINWGCVDLPIFRDCKHIQPPLAVRVAVNKLTCLGKLEEYDVKTVEWTSLLEEAQDWKNNNHVIVARTKLTGHSGDGIVIIERDQPIVLAPLYTKYVFKEKEFRVHVVGNKVIDTQQKIRDPEREPVNWKVRSHENGFIFARNNIQPDPNRDLLAVSAIAALGLDFGAVDIIQDKNKVYYVLEVNTAPGLEGQTIESYARAFREEVR